MTPVPDQNPNPIEVMPFRRPSTHLVSTHFWGRAKQLAIWIALLNLLLLFVPLYLPRGMVAKSDTALPPWISAVDGKTLQGRVLLYTDWAGRDWLYITPAQRGKKDSPTFRLNPTYFPNGCAIDWFAEGWNSLGVYSESAIIRSNSVTLDPVHPSHRSSQRGLFPSEMLSSGTSFGVFSENYGGVFFRVSDCSTTGYHPFRASLLEGGGWLWQAFFWLTATPGILFLTILYAKTGKRRFGVFVLCYAFLFGSIIFEHPYEGMGGGIDAGDDSYYVAYTQNLLKHADWFREPTHLQVGKRVVEHNHGLPGLSLFLAPGAIIQSLTAGESVRRDIDVGQLRYMRITSATYSLLAIILLFLTLHAIQPWWGNIPLAAFLIWGTSLSKWTYQRCIFTHAAEMALLCGLLLLVVLVRKQFRPKVSSGILAGLLLGSLCIVRGEYTLAWPLIPWLLFENSMTWSSKQRWAWLAIYTAAFSPFIALNQYATHHLSTGYATLGSSSIITDWKSFTSLTMWQTLGHNCRELLESYLDAGLVLFAGLTAWIALFTRKSRSCFPVKASISWMVIFFLATAIFPVPLGSEWQHRYSLKLYPLAIVGMVALAATIEEKHRRYYLALVLGITGFSYVRELFCLAQHEHWSLPGVAHGNGFLLLSDTLLTTKGLSDPEWLTLRFALFILAVGWSLLYLTIVRTTHKRMLSKYVILAMAWLIMIAAPTLMHHVRHFFSQQGFSVTYFRHDDLTIPVGTKTEDYVEKSYGKTRPTWRNRHRLFSARWQGELRVPETAQYSFYMESDDGSRLWIDNRCVIDNWLNRDWRGSGRHAEIELLKGQHAICIEHVKRGGTGGLRLKWEGGPIPANTILGVPFVVKQSAERKDAQD